MSQVAVVSRAGVWNALAVCAAAEAEGLDLPIAVAYVAKESDGRNVYGHDSRATYSTRDADVTIGGKTFPRGSNVPVTPENFTEYERLVLAGGRPNGVGLMQITYAGPILVSDGTRSGGYLLQARQAKLDLSIPLDNMRFGLRLVSGNLRAAWKAGLSGRDALQRAAVVYNQGNPTNWQTHPYGLDWLRQYDLWTALLDQPLPRLLWEEQRLAILAGLDEISARLS